MFGAAFCGEIGNVACCRVYWVYGGAEGEGECLWMMRIHQCGAFNPVRRCFPHVRQGPRNRVYPPVARSLVFVPYIPRFLMQRVGVYVVIIGGGSFPLAPPLGCL